MTSTKTKTAAEERSASQDERIERAVVVGRRQVGKEHRRREGRGPVLARSRRTPHMTLAAAAAAAAAANISTAQPVAAVVSPPPPHHQSSSCSCVVERPVDCSEKISSWAVGVVRRLAGEALLRFVTYRTVTRTVVASMCDSTKTHQICKAVLSALW